MLFLLFLLWRVIVSGMHATKCGLRYTRCILPVNFCLARRNFFFSGGRAEHCGSRETVREARRGEARRAYEGRVVTKRRSAAHARPPLCHVSPRQPREAGVSREAPRSCPRSSRSIGVLLSCIDGRRSPLPRRTGRVSARVERECLWELERLEVEELHVLGVFGRRAGHLHASRALGAVRSAGRLRRADRVRVCARALSHRFSGPLSGRR